MNIKDIQVGDHVRIRSWEDMKSEYGTNSYGDIQCKFIFNTAMRPLCELEGIVREINDEDVRLTIGDIDSLCQTLLECCAISADMLEPAKEFDEDIDLDNFVSTMLNSVYTSNVV